MKQIKNPIFVIGTGRCGSTVIFEALAVHEDLGWFSSYNDKLPSLELASAAARVYDLPVLRRLPRGEKPQYKQGAVWFNKLLPKPSECYPKWEVMCGKKFRDDYLLGVTATQLEYDAVHKAVRNVLSLQGKSRFAAKLTGPPRIGYLRSIFPDAIFVHVIRDGRAVVNSWLNVDFWKNSGAYHEPKWKNGLPENWQEEWQRYDGTPMALAALQYRTIIQTSREESKDLEPWQYTEIHYEDFVQDPAKTLREVQAFCQLPNSPAVEAYISSDKQYTNMNKKYLERFNERELEILNLILQ